MKTASFLTLVVFVVAMSMYLVWQRSETRRIGYECGALHRQALQLQEENRRLLSEISALKSPQLIALKARSMDLGLTDADVSRPAVSEAKPEKKTPAQAASVAALPPSGSGIPTTRVR